MPFGSLWSPNHVITADDLCSILEPKTGPISRRIHRPGDTAQRFELSSGDFFGVIPTHSTPFCGHCDRLRLTANGTLLPCLFSTQGVDVRELIRRGADEDTLQEAVAQSLAKKGIGYLEEQQQNNKNSNISNNNKVTMNVGKDSTCFFSPVGEFCLWHP